MTENKRYSEQNLENHLNRIYDNHEGKVIFDEEIVDLLNEQDEQIRELEKEKESLKTTIITITIAYQKKHNNTIVNLIKESVKNGDMNDD